MSDLSFKRVIIIEEIGVGVREGDRTDGRHERVARWVVKGVFRAEVGGVSLSKSGNSGWLIFLRCIPNASVNFKFP